MFRQTAVAELRFSLACSTDQRGTPVLTRRLVNLEIESGSRNELQQRLRVHRLCPILIKASTRFGCGRCASHPQDAGRIACGPGSNHHTSEAIAVAGNQNLPGEDLKNGIAAVGKQTLLCRTSRHRFGRRPRSIQVGCCHRARDLRRVGPQIFFRDLLRRPQAVPRVDSETSNPENRLCIWAAH